jgi:hypothetical protein
MNMPPMVMKINIQNEDTDLNLWLPLFIIVPLVGIILLALFLVLLPLMLVAALIFWRRCLFRFLLILPIGLRCLCASRGLEVDIVQGQEKVLISVK